MSINAKEYHKKPDKFNKNVNKVMKIEKMRERTAFDVYGDTAKDPDKAVLVMIEGDVHVNLNMAKGIMLCEDEGEFLIEDMTAYRRAMNNDQSKWRRFVKKYGVPEIGMKVNLMLNDNLYYEILYEDD